MGNDEKKELVLRLSAAIARLKEITSAPPHVYAIPGANDRLSVKRDTVLMAQFRLAEAASTIERLEHERDALREALTEIASFTQTDKLLWWQERARAALLHEGQ